MDRLFQRVERVVRRRRLCAHPRRGDAGDDLRRRRAVRLNGVMGAKAERSLVFHVVGMPSYQHQRVHKIAHHTLGDGVFGNFVELSARRRAVMR